MPTAGANYYKISLAIRSRWCERIQNKTISAYFTRSHKKCRVVFVVLRGNLLMGTTHYGRHPLWVPAIKWKKIIQRPIYAGVNFETWTTWQPKRTQWNGLVSIKTWNDANRGKWFIEERSDDSIAMHKDYNPSPRTIENSLYPYKDEDLKRDIQAERVRLDQLLKDAQGYRNKLEVSQQDLEEFIWRVNWVIEHLNLLGFLL